MNPQPEGSLARLIDEFFNRTIKDDLVKYTQLTRSVSKWTCFSDYCFDDANKPNDVACFTLIPYIDDAELLCNYIKSIAAVDIKKTQKVNEKFISFLKDYPLINFSFIINDRKSLFGTNHQAVKASLLLDFGRIIEHFKTWELNRENGSSYKSIIKKLSVVLKLINQNKKIKQIVDMLVVTFLGAYFSSHIIKSNNVEIFGWFSDRDALNDVCDNLSISLFQYFLYNLAGGDNFRFVAAPAGSRDNAFYEELVRIPDYIAGTIADFNISDNVISKDKFNTVLTNYMAENTHNNFICRIFSDQGILSAGRVKIFSTEKH